MIREPLQINYDPDTDILVINGTKFTGDIFREGFQVTPKGFWWRSLTKSDGIVTMQQMNSAAILNIAREILEAERGKR